MIIAMNDILEYATLGSVNSPNTVFAAYSGKGIAKKQGSRCLLRDSQRFKKFAANPGIQRLESGYRQLLSSYIRRVPLLLKDMEFQLCAANSSPVSTNWAENPLDSYALTVHGIKFASEGILAQNTAVKAEKLEAAALRGDLSYLTEMTPEFLTYMKCFLSKLKRFTEK
jgi:hypothetical protein